MLVSRARRALVPLLITGGLVAASAGCVEITSDPEATGLVIPSAPTLRATRPLATGRPTPSAITPTTPTSTSSAKLTASVNAATADGVRHTYRPDGPVGPSDLRTITMTCRTYEGQVRTGVLIVATTHVETVVDVFRQAFDAGFRINRMDNPNLWNGDDEQMTAADNTSAFNCRPVAGKPSKLSPHSYGTAIDVNTRRNPSRAAPDVWYPANGVRWVDRSLDDVGMIRSSSALTTAVLAAGGTWGGGRPYPCYEHFELDGRLA
ncbi:MAG: M15 family metallopeptidase [Terracoccus sp.]